MNTIYISRRCDHCHELLVKLHKNKNILKYPVVDVDTNPYPKEVNSVPSLVTHNNILTGLDLFNYLDNIINQYTKDNLPGEPSKNLNSNSEQPNKECSIPNNQGEIDGFCFGNSCNLSFSSIEGNSFDSMYSQYENITNDNKQMNNVNSNNQKQINNTRKEKSAQMDTDYEKMIESRKMINPSGGDMMQVPPR